MAEPLTLINAFEVPGEQAGQFIAAWENFRAAIQSPGFLESAAGLAGYRPHPGLYQIVRT